MRPRDRAAKVFSPGAPNSESRVAGVHRAAVEREVLPVADPGQEIEPEQVREAVDRVALALPIWRRPLESNSPHRTAHGRAPTLSVA